MSRLTVVGSGNIDLVALAPRHPARGETVLGDELRTLPGGKGANQAVAGARLGAPTRFVGCLGADAFGDTLAEFLQREGVDLTHVRRDPGTSTGVALIVVAGGDNTIVVVPGANGLLTGDDVASVPMGANDVVVAQREIPYDAVRAALRKARAAGATTVLNPAPAHAGDVELLGLVDVLVVNEIELTTLCGTAGEVADLAGHLRQRGAANVIATLGAAGAIGVFGDEVVVEPGRPVVALDSTGAGDCFVGALAARLLVGDPLPRAMHLATVAASLSVERLGAATSMPTLEEVMMA